jgi:hypothetical protein
MNGKKPSRNPKIKTSEKTAHRIELVIDDDVFKSLADFMFMAKACGGGVGIQDEFCLLLVSGISRGKDFMHIVKKEKKIKK